MATKPTVIVGETVNMPPLPGIPSVAPPPKGIPGAGGVGAGSPPPQTIRDKAKLTG